MCSKVEKDEAMGCLFLDAKRYLSGVTPIPIMC